MTNLTDVKQYLQSAKDGLNEVKGTSNAIVKNHEATLGVMQATDTLSLYQQYATDIPENIDTQALIEAIGEFFKLPQLAQTADMLRYMTLTALQIETAKACTKYLTSLNKAELDLATAMKNKDEKYLKEIEYDWDTGKATSVYGYRINTVALHDFITKYQENYVGFDKYAINSLQHNIEILDKLNYILTNMSAV